MAKKPTRRRGRFRRYIRGNVDETLTAAALAPQALASAVFDESVVERTFVSSLIASWSLSGVTPAAGDGPLLVGIAHQDYTDAEIEAFIEATGSWSEADLVAQEVSKRKIRIVGTFAVPADALETVVLNDGKPIRTKLGWILTTGQSLDLWAYNLGSSAFATTTPTVHVQGHANLWPR